MVVVTRLRAPRGGPAPVDRAHLDRAHLDRAEVDALLRARDLALVPMHPNTSDPDLASWFVVPDVLFDQAEEIAKALRALPGVEAAFVQPSPAPA